MACPGSSVLMMEFCSCNGLLRELCSYDGLLRDVCSYDGLHRELCSYLLGQQFVNPRFSSGPEMGWFDLAS